MLVKGKVFTGIGRGSYFLSIPRYREGIKKYLGFNPFPGTLNVRLECECCPRFQYKIPRFEYNGRKYGEVLLAPVRLHLKGDVINAGVVFPKRTCWSTDVLEIVCEEDLRRKYNLKDGDTVKIEFVDLIVEKGSPNEQKA